MIQKKGWGGKNMSLTTKTFESLFKDMSMTISRFGLVKLQVEAVYSSHKQIKHDRSKGRKQF